VHFIANLSHQKISASTISIQKGERAVEGGLGLEEIERRNDRPNTKKFGWKIPISDIR
jgi:hypothetical protein